MFGLFERPWWLLLFIPLIILFYFLINHNFLAHRVEYKGRRNVVLLLRVFMLLFLLLALASPFVHKMDTVQSTPRVKFLVDESDSFSIFDKSKVNDLAGQLEQRIPVENKVIVSGQKSNIGDGILKEMSDGDSLLLVTDGNNNDGIKLSEVGVSAISRNVTINALDLSANTFDASVEIVGPDKTVGGVENEYLVVLSKSKEGSVRLKVLVDGKVIYEDWVDQGFSFKAKFDEGYHTLEAHLDQDDYFKDNNEFYKVVKVVEKPKVLVYSQKETSLNLVLSGMNQVDIVNTLNENMLKDYYTLILNDIPYSDLNDKMSFITDYVSEGNGLVVVGGQSSYDKGEYENSMLENILPVYVAESQKTKGEALSVVLLIDISGSTGESFGDDKKVDVEKSMALSVLKDLSLVHKVAVIAFNSQAYVVSNLSFLYEQEGLDGKIASLVDGGATYIDTGLIGAVNMLKDAPGSKNIILISDGNTKEVQKTLDATRYAASMGIKVFTVGIGGDTNSELMKQIADLGMGSYFKPSEEQKIKLIFGQSEVSGDRGAVPLTVYEEDHFITQGVDLNAILYGYNVVSPKLTSKLLIVSDMGDPIVTSGRFGLGRVVAVATDDGGLYAPDLLNQDNSKLWTRIVNWGIGDPERKNDYYVDFAEFRVNQSAEVLLKTTKEPELGLDFVKIDQDLYKATLVENSVGVKNLAGALYAVNYPIEYSAVGIGDELRNLVTDTGGNWFKVDEVDNILEFVKAKSFRKMYVNDSLSWIFVLIVILLYVGEIAYLKLGSKSNL